MEDGIALVALDVSIANPLALRSGGGTAARQAFEMLDHLVDMHHVGIFVMQVEQIDLVAQHRAVVGAFLDHDVVEAVGIGVDRRGAHAARRALAADDQAIRAGLAQMRDQRRAEESRGALLVDHDFARLGAELVLDVVEFLRLLAHAAIGRTHPPVSAWRVV